MGHQALASVISKSRTAGRGRREEGVEPVSHGIADRVNELTCDNTSPLDAPYSNDAYRRLDGEEEEGHGEMAAGDDVLQGPGSRAKAKGAGVGERYLGTTENESKKSRSAPEHHGSSCLERMSKGQTTHFVDHGHHDTRRTIRRDRKHCASSSSAPTLLSHRLPPPRSAARTHPAPSNSAVQHPSTPRPTPPSSYLRPANPSSTPVEPRPCPCPSRLQGIRAGNCPSSVYVRRGWVWGLSRRLVQEEIG